MTACRSICRKAKLRYHMQWCVERSHLRKLRLQNFEPIDHRKPSCAALGDILIGVGKHGFAFAIGLNRLVERRISFEHARVLKHESPKTAWLLVLEIPLE